MVFLAPYHWKSTSYHLCADSASLPRHLRPIKFQQHVDPRGEKADSDDDSSDGEPESVKESDRAATYEQMLELMQPQETVAKALRRFGETEHSGDEETTDASRRWPLVGEMTANWPTYPWCSITYEMFCDFVIRLNHSFIWISTWLLIHSLIP